MRVQAVGDTAATPALQMLLTGLPDALQHRVTRPAQPPPPAQPSTPEEDSAWRWSREGAEGSGGLDHVRRGSRGSGQRERVWGTHGPWTAPALPSCTSHVWGNQLRELSKVTRLTRTWNEDHHGGKKSALPGAEPRAHWGDCSRGEEGTEEADARGRWVGHKEIGVWHSRGVGTSVFMAQSPTHKAHPPHWAGQAGASALTLLKASGPGVTQRSSSSVHIHIQAALAITAQACRVPDGVWQSPGAPRPPAFYPSSPRQTITKS